MNKWYDTLLTTPEPVSVPVIETPVTVAPTAPVAPPVTRQEPQVLEPQVPDFEIDAMLTANGATFMEIWCVKECFKEKGITPDTTLAWLWLNKIRLRERL